MSAPVEPEDDEIEKKTSKATIIRRALLVALVLACIGVFVYTRYVVKKGTIGESCSYDIHCRAEAPRCLKPSTEGEGVCSRSCETDADCATAIKCIKVELEDRDERGRPLEGGYCFPQSLLDARRKRRDGGAAAPAAKADSWLDVPEVPGQLEGEVTVERGGQSHVYLVKGTLLRTKGKRGTTIVDTAALRVYSVDEDKKTFGASQLASSDRDPPAKLTKTERHDKVADQDCEIWQVDDAAGKGTAREACVLKGASFLDPGSHAVSPLDKELTVRGVFPLRITEGDKAKHLVTRLDRRPVDASLFVIPKTYKNLAGGH